MATDSDRLFQQAAAVPSSRAAHVNSKSNGLSLFMSEAATRDQRRSPGRADDCSLLTVGRYLSSPPTISGAAAAVSVRRTWERGGVPPLGHSREIEVVAVMSSMIATISQKTVHDGLESGCRLVDLCVNLSVCSFFSETKVFHIVLCFLRLTLGAFQRTYSELLAHLEIGGNGVQSG